MRTRLALLAAVILGIVATIGVRSYLRDVDKKRMEEAVRVPILVARESLRPGDVLRESAVKSIEADQTVVSSMHILYDQRSGYLGQRLNRQVRTGKPVMKDAFVAIEAPDLEQRGILSGWRAITVGADQISGVAGLIRPRSRVDIIATRREQSMGPATASSAVSEVLVTNVEVLAIDNRTSMRVPVRPGGGRQFDQGYSSLTLHVLPIEASLLAYAQGVAKLTFILRNPGDSSASDTTDTPAVSKDTFRSVIDAARNLRMRKLQETPSARTGLTPTP